MRIGVLTSGGDAPGMNAAIRTVAVTGIAHGHELVGIRQGYRGLLDGNTVPLSLPMLDGISRYGGTMLGSARCPEFCTPAGLQRGLESIASEGLQGLVVIGGNGSLTGAHKLAQQSECQLVGIPASIDNDVGHCGLAIGTDTAVNTIVEACDRISDTARAHRRAFLVDVMVRESGFLAMRAGIAAEADAILYGEKHQSEDEIVAHLTAVLDRVFERDTERTRALIVKAEGVEASTTSLVRRLQEHLDKVHHDVEIRATVLGHVVRGGGPTALDRVIAQRLGYAAIVGLEEGRTDVMASWDVPLDFGEATLDPYVRYVGLADMIDETRALLDGSSPVVKVRMSLLGQVESLLAL
ncbi:MAG: 6-phosphofructokinase [Myxococcales bacterium]|nr:6-phosphofructokinase [Myxococcales bacterium]